MSGISFDPWGKEPAFEDVPPPPEDPPYDDGSYAAPYEFPAPPPAPPQLDATAAPARLGPERFFGKNGLNVLALSQVVAGRVTYGLGALDGRFWVYEGGVWRPDPDDEVICSELVQLLGDRYRPGHRAAVLEVLRFNRTRPRIDAGPVPALVNLPNGLYKWKTGELLPHTPDALSVTQLPVRYNPDAECPEFTAFLHSVLPADCLEPRDGGPGFIWELLGYACYSGNPLHLAVLLFGTGRNGKGVFLHALEKLIGRQNTSSVALHDLIGNRFRASTLYGKLANIAGDLDSTYLENTALFKAITGGDSISAEHKFGAAFDFTPWAVPFFSANKAFGSADSSEGYFRRWVVVPFPRSFIGQEDRGLEGRVGTTAELEGILRRSLEALPALMERGRLPEPPSTVEAKQQFIVSADRVRAWIEEDCILEEDAVTPRTELYAAFRAWTDANGGRQMSAPELYSRLDQLAGIAQRKRKGTRVYVGIRMLRDFEKRGSET